MGGRILIVDDEKDMLQLFQRIIAEETDNEVTTESDPCRALELFRETPFDMVITDLKMPQMDGMQLMDEVKRIRPDAAVVILTAYATIDNAVEAIRKGAFDYLTKPCRRDRILVTIDKVMAWQEVIKENRRLKQTLAQISDEYFMAGSSPLLKAIWDKIRRVAPTNSTVLITGASGTGKELVARAVHRHSLRSEKKLVVVNCTSLPENVLESELFGHVRGAFTGAWKDKRGLVEEADGGTLFLDEIGDLAPAMQTKLLRLLQEGEYKPVGSVTTKKADIRFIAATNHSLKDDIKEKRFREDLYYRLNVIHFELPPLSRRKQDIPLLAQHFLQKYSRLNGKDIRGVSPGALQALASRDYPGNIRELENIIERGVVYCETDNLSVIDLGLEDENSLFDELDEELGRLSFKDAKNRVIQAFHRRYIGLLLEESGGNISKAAEIAGIQRQYLHRLLKEAGIDAVDYKENGD